MRRGATATLPLATRPPHPLHPAILHPPLLLSPPNCSRLGLEFSEDEDDTIVTP